MPRIFRQTYLEFHFLRLLRPPQVEQEGAGRG